MDIVVAIESIDVMEFIYFSIKIAPPGFEPGSFGPEPKMIGLYTMGLYKLKNRIFYLKLLP